MKKITFLILSIVLIFALNACNSQDTVTNKKETTAHTHTFSDATCTEPQKCSCGETNGEALGHTWADATCTTPKTCSVCSETEGEALGHKWANATCTKPKTCGICFATEGNVVHTYENGICIYCKETKAGLKLGSKYYRISGDTIHIHGFSSDGYLNLPSPWVSSQSEWTTDKCIYYKGRPYYQLTGIGGPAIARFVVTDTEILVYNYDISDGSLEELDFKMIVNENGDLVITYSSSDYYKVGEVWLHSLD